MLRMPIALSKKVKSESIKLFVNEQEKHFSTIKNKLQELAKSYSYSFTDNKETSCFIYQLGEKETITLNYDVDTTSKTITKLS